MSGHSHWATIKHKKGAADARRGKLWSKLCRAIQIAAKEGGGNADMNLKLQNAIIDARAESVPNDNITRSIKRYRTRLIVVTGATNVGAEKECRAGRVHLDKESIIDTASVTRPRCAGR